MIFRLFVFFLFISSVGFCQTDLRGLEFEDDEYNSLPLKPSYFTPQSAIQPTSYSLKKYCPRVITQHNANTGVAWATVWYARTMLEAIANGWKEPAKITQNAFSPIYNYKQIVKGDGCSEKIKLTSILESLHTDGSIPFNDFTEFCYTTVPTLPKARASILPGYVKLFSTNDKKDRKVEVIKAALRANSPVVLGMICPPSFSLATDFWQPREMPTPDQGGHAITVVGYDDSKFGGAFEIVNSWGKSWGNEGFTWFRYEDVENYIVYGFELLNTQSLLKPARLSAQVEFSLNTSETMKATIENPGYYKLNKSYATGAQFKILTKVNQNAFFYAIGFDKEWNHAELFPNEKNGLYPWIEDDRRTIKLPIESDFIELTPPAGKNYLCFVFSGQYISIEEITNKLKDGKRNFIERYYSGQLKNSAILKWTDNAIEFEGDFNRSSLWIVVVEIDQD
jgi:hypothetical protein